MNALRSTFCAIAIILSAALSGCGQPAGSEVPVILEPTLRPTVPAGSAPSSAPAPAAGEVVASVIFHNGLILTMDDALPTASAIHIQGERIVSVGDDASVLAGAGAATVVVDLQGRTMTPGFIDSHTHRLSQYDRWGHSGPEEIIQESLRQGWTGLVDAAVDEGEWNEVRDLAERGRLPIRADGISCSTRSEGNLPDWYNLRPGSGWVQPARRGIEVLHRL
jgi:predicted amidohydrolase YtcJ